MTIFFVSGVLSTLFALVRAQPTCALNTTHPSLLPSALTPTHYALVLKLPDPNQGGNDLSFTGSVSIDLRVAHSTSCVVLNVGRFINITAASIAGKALSQSAISYDRHNEMVVISLKNTLAVGSLIDVMLEYSGQVLDGSDPDQGAHGLFLSPNTVPPPSQESVEYFPAAKDPMAALERWRLKNGRRAQQRKGTQRHFKMLQSARADGSTMMFATQLEESDARQMFPCIDEPAYKATFDIQVSVPANSSGGDNSTLTVLSNTLETSSVVSGARRVFIFRRTLHPLPTYLVAVTVGHFDFLEANSGGVQYRIVTPPGYKDWAHLALNATVHATEFFGRKFGLPYSMMNSKMDSISVAAFDMDAMENQGLLTYAPQMLLLNPDPFAVAPPPLSGASRLVQAQLIVAVVTHEILHQWFGDTVTMRDWDQEYLNEGFARLMQSYGADDLVPDWDFLCLHGSSQTRGNSLYQFTYEVALTFDMLGTAPSVVYPLPGGGDLPPFSQSKGSNLLNAQEQDPTKAPLFSRIFYEKGASVNRMVASHLGWDTWADAIGRHAQRFRWQNPTVEDLMRSLDSAFGERAQTKMGATALTAMLPWLQRPGFPVVSLELLPGGREVRATQRPASRYLPADRAMEPWWLPLMISVNNSAPFLFELTSATDIIKVPVLSMPATFRGTGASADVGRVVGDPSFMGMFLVQYADAKQWDARILDASDFVRTPPDYRRNIAFSASALASMSHEPVSLFARVAAAMAQPLSQVSKIGGWNGSSDMYSCLFKLAQPLATVLDSAAYTFGANPAVVAAASELKRAMADVSGPVAQRLAWNSETDSEAWAQVDASEHSEAPWPQRDDPGDENREQHALRPTALLQAVIYGDQDTIKMGLSIFRRAVVGTGNHSVPAAIARPAFFAVVRNGENDDWKNLRTMYGSSSSKNSRADILFALTAGAATDGRCAIGLNLLASLTSEQMRLDALVDMLNFAPRCRLGVMSAYVTSVRSLWLEQGASATQAVLKGFLALSSKSELQLASMLLAEQNSTVVSSDDAHAALTQVRVNIDMVEFNSLGSSGGNQLSLFV